MKKKIKTLIFDNEWVLVRNDWTKVAKEFSEEFGTPLLEGIPFKKSLQVEHFGFNILQEYSKGKIISDYFWRVVFEKGYNIFYSKKAGKKASKIFSHLTTEENKYLIDYIKDNKYKYNLFILSNSNEDIERGNKERNNYFELFDDVFYSHDRHFRKPESAAYVDVLRKHDLEASDCYFIDDKPENVKAAGKEGINGIFYSMDGNLEDLIKMIE